jgi:phosphoenolpyruvate carboxykinase (GTP)
MGKMTEESKLPKLFYVNWFRKNQEGKFIWPGFGDNSRVLKWIFERCDGEGKANLSPIGYTPTLDALDLSGLNLSTEIIKELTEVDIAAWKLEAKSIRDYYKSIGEKMPLALYEELDALENRLNQ